MLKPTDRVRFINKEKDNKYGVLIIKEIIGQIAICGSGDYTNLASPPLNINLIELINAE